MMTMPSGSALAMLFTILLCASCAVSPEAEERRRSVQAEIDAILSEPVDPNVYGTTQRCLSELRVRNFRALDDRRILFEGPQDRLWINSLRTRCPDLQYAAMLRVRSTSSMGRVCELDTFVPGDWFRWPWYRRWPWQWGTMWSTGIKCTLGEFQPVTKDQVQAIEAALRSR